MVADQLCGRAFEISGETEFVEIVVVVCRDSDSGLWSVTSCAFPVFADLCVSARPK